MSMITLLPDDFKSCYNMENTDRGVSTTINYVLFLGLTAILSAVFIGVTSSFVIGQRKAALHDGYIMIGQLLARDIQVMNQMVFMSVDSQSISMVAEYPRVIANVPYELIIKDTAQTNIYELTIQSESRVEASYTIEIYSRLPLETGPVNSGRIEMTYDPSTNKVIFNAK